MINLHFSITIPTFRKKRDRVLFNRHRYWKVSEHKSIEVQTWYRSWTDLFDITFRWTLQGDHAGLQIGATVLGLMGDFEFYDDRHWDYENNRYEIYEDGDGHEGTG